MFLVPETSNIIVAHDGTLPDKNWVEAVPYKEDMEDFHPGFRCRFFLVPPPPESPSAYFAIKEPENPLDAPNMMFEDIVVTSTTGVTLRFNIHNKNNCHKMAAAAEAEDIVMRFKIRVLVNQEALNRGDILTRPEKDKMDCAEKQPKTRARITPSALLQKEAKSRKTT